MEPADSSSETGIQGPREDMPLQRRDTGRAARSAGLDRFGGPDGDRRPATRVRGDPSLRGQVLDVIADVVSGTATSPEVRQRLLWQLMEYPGNPEQALLSHILGFENP
ncbi:MAG: hypothetical protein K0R37_5 [Arthrobacter sp.]|jgi:hypothetical protein|nr:hypothetical protein [Arthrobacter sp.]